MRAQLIRLESDAHFSKNESEWFTDTPLGSKIDARHCDLQQRGRRIIGFRYEVVRRHSTCGESRYARAANRSGTVALDCPAGRDRAPNRIIRAKATVFAREARCVGPLRRNVEHRGKHVPVRPLMRF